MMEAARTSETLVNFYQTKRRYNPEDGHLRTHRCENLKSYFAIVSLLYTWHYVRKIIYAYMTVVSSLFGHKDVRKGLVKNIWTGMYCHRMKWNQGLLW
jgi:hypothetical protein